MAELVSGITFRATTDENNRQCGQVIFEGLEVTVYRSEIDGKLVVDIASPDLADEDHDKWGVPIVRVNVNDEVVWEPGG